MSSSGARYHSVTTKCVYGTNGSPYCLQAAVQTSSSTNDEGWTQVSSTWFRREVPHGYRRRSSKLVMHLHGQSPECKQRQHINRARQPYQLQKMQHAPHLAMPKSQILSSPRPLYRMLDVLRSRCSTQWWCRNATPSSSCRIRFFASATLWCETAHVQGVCSHCSVSSGLRQASACWHIRGSTRAGCEAMGNWDAQWDCNVRSKP